MKKTKLTRSLLAACSIVALTAVMYGCVHNGGSDPEPMVEPMPEPMPEPEPDPGPTDLEETQSAAAAAATAAEMASTSAEMSASDAMAATMTLATLQTGADSNSDEMGGREHADAAASAAEDAADAAAAAAAASEAAAAATTGDAGEAAWRMAVAAQEAAEVAAMMASDHAEAAIEAAMAELHIDSTMKWAGGLTADAEDASSLDADADTTTSPAGDRVTGFIRDLTRDSDAVTGQPYIEADGQEYRQAVEARSLKIGKVVDTTDDMYRLSIIHSRPTTEMMRVYVRDDDGTLVTDTDGGGIRIGDGPDGTANTDDDIFAPLKSLGMYIEAADIDDVAATPGMYADPPTADADDADQTNVIHDGDAADRLDFSDRVGAETKPKELFSYVDSAGVEQRVVEETRTTNALTGVTTVMYRPVDTLAQAAPDAHGATPDDMTEPNEVPESIVVRASIPTVKAYSHIHFGVWGMLGEADEMDGSQKLASLGIGFVQNISGSGMTDRLGIGTVTYNGNYLAHVQRQNATPGTGAIGLQEGGATLTADFDEGEFMGNLMGLATLEGTLDGNGFSGTKATVVRTHAELDASGDFEGEFSGGIYGPAGTEAAGVFDFDGGEAGAFVGAFGGTNQD